VSYLSLFMVMAEIQGGQAAHQFHAHQHNHHRDGLMQPTLVENHHHLDFKFPEKGIS